MNPHEPDGTARGTGHSGEPPDAGAATERRPMPEGGKCGICGDVSTGIYSLWEEHWVWICTDCEFVRDHPYDVSWDLEQAFTEDMRKIDPDFKLT